MTDINFKVIGLTQQGFKPAGSTLEPAIFGFADLPEREAGTLLIQPPQFIGMRGYHKKSMCVIVFVLPLCYCIFTNKEPVCILHRATAAPTRAAVKLAGYFGIGLTDFKFVCV